MIRSEDIWKTIDLFFRRNSIAQPQIASFDDFIDNSLNIIAADAQKIKYDVEHKEKNSDVAFSRISVQVLKIVPAEEYAAGKPNEYRLQNQTYALKFKASVEFTRQDYLNDGYQQFKPASPKSIIIECPFCPLPLLLNSKHCYLRQTQQIEMRQQRIRNDECPFDEGGYFIINGSEKTLIASEVNRSNRITVLPGDQKNERQLISAKVVSSVPERALYCKVEISLETVKVAQRSAVSNQQHLLIRMPNFDDAQQALVIMMLLYPGETFTDNELLKYISPEQDPEVLNIARQSLQYCYDGGIRTPAAALEHAAANFKNTVRGAISESDTMSDLIRAQNHFATRFLPHVGTDCSCNLSKLAFLGYMCNLTILSYLKRRGFDDRDHWGSKRLQLTGSLLHDLFRRCFNEFQESLAKELQKSKICNIENPTEYDKFVNSFKKKAVDVVTRGFVSSLATGNWRTGRIGQKAGLKTGVSQNLVRLSYAAAISQIRRTTSGIEESSKAIGPRILHGTQFGYLCPAETPEGAKVGLVKNFSLQCRITVGGHENEVKVISEIENYKFSGAIALRRLHLAKGLEGVKIFVNGQWIGSIANEQAKHLADYLKKCRVESKISFESSICYNEEARELIIATDAGRVIRPLFVVKTRINQQTRLCEQCDLRITAEHINNVFNMQNGWEELLKHKDHMIEYLDPYEEEQSLICTDLKTFDQNRTHIQQIQKGDFSTIPLAYTHMEIHPCMVLSAISAIIPYPDHNQAPRNLFQASMGKQAIGIYALNFEKRFDTQGINVLHYAQKPLAQTRTMKYVKFTDLPAGTVLTVAIAVYTGFNQEDSLIMSHAAVDRGMMRCYYYLAHETECEPEAVDMSKKTLQQKICRPVDDVEAPMDRACGEYLQADGIGRVGQTIKLGKIVIGKKVPKKDMHGQIGASGNQFVDASTVIKNDEIGFIDSAVLTREKKDVGIDGAMGTTLTAKVKVRQNRPPQLGDKFSSRHGQKGTVGMLYRHEDMPYTTQGITPDIILNPHAIPSRMTIGQLLECLGSKVGAMLGTAVDCTPFEPPVEFASHEEYLTNKLHQCGFQRHGYEAMFCGFTGKLLQYRIFIGPTFYQRLKHITLDKISARSTGQYTTLTHQPVEGRQQGGGMRIGEMERDAFIAHGASAVLRDRLQFSSDDAEFIVCRTCGQIVWHADRSRLTTQNVPRCAVCEHRADFAVVSMPFVCKLLFQEIQAMGVFPKLIVQTE